MKKFIGLILLITMLTPIGASMVFAQTQQKPNIILIMADDLGFNYIEPYGNKGVITPNLTMLAEEGMKFENYYANPLCGQTRSALMSGKYSQQYGFRLNCQVGSATPRGLPNDVVSMAKRLRKLGYSTNHVGKWHLGYNIDAHFPLKFGYDYFFGAFKKGQALQRMNPTLFENYKESKYTGHMTNVLGNKVLDIIRQNKDSDKPFFINYWEVAPHIPNLPIKGWLNGYPDTSPLSNYYADITGLDRNVGQIVKVLKDTGQWENTIVIFTSDNGLVSKLEPYTDNGGLRGSKGKTTEGGTRSPFIITWPAKIERSSVTEMLSHVTDISPTLVDIAGGEQPNTDGRSILPTLLGGSQPPRDIYFENKNLDFIYGAYRSGDWKYAVENGTGEYLYNIAADRFETTNLKNQNPTEYNRLRDLFWTKRLELAKVNADYNKNGGAPITFTNNSFKIDQANKFIKTSKETEMTLSSWELSFTAWIKLDPSGKGKSRSITSSDTNVRFQVGKENRLRLVLLQTLPDGTKEKLLVQDSTVLDFDKWYHVGFVIDATTLHKSNGIVKVYINGESNSIEYRKSDVLTSGQFIIGNDSKLVRPLMGEVAAPQFYASTLLNTEMSELSKVNPVTSEIYTRKPVSLSDLETIPSSMVNINGLRDTSVSDEINNYSVVFKDEAGNVGTNFMFEIPLTGFLEETDSEGRVVLPYTEPTDFTYLIRNGLDDIEGQVTAAEMMSAIGGEIIIDNQELMDDPVDPTNDLIGPVFEDDLDSSQNSSIQPFGTVLGLVSVLLMTLGVLLVVAIASWRNKTA